MDLVRVEDPWLDLGGTARGAQQTQSQHFMLRQQFGSIELNYFVDIIALGGFLGVLLGRVGHDGELSDGGQGNDKRRWGQERDGGSEEQGGIEDNE